MIPAVRRAVEARLVYLRRELEIAEREAARPLFDLSTPDRQLREYFQHINEETAHAKAAIPFLDAEIAVLEAAE